jgi:hypothetical protein
MDISLTKVTFEIVFCYIREELLNHKIALNGSFEIAKSFEM